MSNFNNTHSQKFRVIDCENLHLSDNQIRNTSNIKYPGTIKYNSITKNFEGYVGGERTDRDIIDGWTV